VLCVWRAEGTAEGQKKKLPSSRLPFFPQNFTVSCPGTVEAQLFIHRTITIALGGRLRGWRRGRSAPCSHILFWPISFLPPLLERGEVLPLFLLGRAPLRWQSLRNRASINFKLGSGARCVKEPGPRDARGRAAIYFIDQRERRRLRGRGGRPVTRQTRLPYIRTKFAAPLFSLSLSLSLSFFTFAWDITRDSYRAQFMCMRAGTVRNISLARKF
jgi:hypothetical protein